MYTELKGNTIKGILDARADPIAIHNLLQSFRKIQTTKLRLYLPFTTSVGYTRGSGSGISENSENSVYAYAYMNKLH